MQKTENLRDSLPAAENKIHQMYKEHKIKLRPYVIINGPSLNDVKSAFVILEKHKYQVPILVAAIDLCFQCMKIFGEQYSTVCNHVWQSAERKVYKFEVKDLYLSVPTVIENLRKFN